MEQVHINNSRSRLVNNPELLNLFDLGIDTVNKLGISVDDLKPCKDNNRWRIHKRILEQTKLFDAGSIPPRAASIEFLIDYFFIYHYDI